VINYGYASDKLVLMILREVELYHKLDDEEEEMPDADVAMGTSDNIQDEEDFPDMDEWEETFHNNHEDMIADDEELQEEEEFEFDDMDDNTVDDESKPHHISMSAEVIKAAKNLLRHIKSTSPTHLALLNLYIQVIDF
jgi:hypothetical protein